MDLTEKDGGIFGAMDVVLVAHGHTFMGMLLWKQLSRLRHGASSLNDAGTWRGWMPKLPAS